ncbi:MAG: hypothetical protein K6G70_01220 [Bacteroidaceae bacterium]|nr:hypothetical protein [Bacteroidaceae bacterium]
MKYISCFACAIILCSAITSCEKIEEEPTVNLGYESDVRVPDSEELTTEDLDSIQKLKDEYTQNAI